MAIESSQYWAERNASLIARTWKNGRPLVTPIAPADRQLYREFSASDNRIACYGNGWTYVTQACRGFGLGMKYFDGDMLCSFGYHRGHYVLVRPLGVLDGRIIDLLDVLRQVSGRPVYLKKLAGEEVATLQAMATFGNVSEYPWDASAPADDDTYPEVILDAALSFDRLAPVPEWWEQVPSAWTAVDGRIEEGRRHLKKVRQRIRRFHRDTTSCRIIPYTANLAGEARAFLAAYFGPDRPRDVEAYENMLTYVPAEEERNSFFCFVAYVSEGLLPSAFVYAEQLDQASAGIYAAIASRNHYGLAYYLYTELFKQLKERGIRYVNLGGSEHEGLHQFKRRLAPVQECQMLVYGVH